MARKREERRPRRMKKVILVVCEGETEAAYVDFLRQSYRLPIKIVSKVSGHDVSKRKLDAYRKDLRLFGKEGITTFLMYDLDIEGIFGKLKHLDASLLLSNPCIELWFLLHCSNQRSELSADECIRRLQSSDQTWNDYRKPSLNSKQREFLWNNKEDAVQKAEALKDFENPSSTIYKLIKILDSEINFPSGTKK